MTGLSLGASCQGFGSGRGGPPVISSLANGRRYQYILREHTPDTPSPLAGEGRGEGKLPASAAFTLHIDERTTDV